VHDLLDAVEIAQRVLSRPPAVVIAA